MDTIETLGQQNYISRYVTFPHLNTTSEQCGDRSGRDQQHKNSRRHHLKHKSVSRS